MEEMGNYGSFTPGYFQAWLSTHCVKSSQGASRLGTRKKKQKVCLPGKPQEMNLWQRASVGGMRARPPEFT